MTKYLIIISVLAVILTVYDKIASKKFRKSRVPEKILLGIGFIGGAAPEYLTMKIIRHKTRHKKFMVWLPVFAAIHIIITVLYHFYL